MKYSKYLAFTLVATTLVAPLAAQDQRTKSSTVKSQQSQQSYSPLDDRGGMPVPKNLLDLKNLSLSFWIKYRGTNQQIYRYINETVQFHAYAEVCKRHDLKIKMAPLTDQANHYIQASIPAHYDEPEFALLEPLSKAEQQAFLNDMSSDIYAFEFGYRIAEQNHEIAASGKTRQSFCAGVRTNYRASYIALRVAAKDRIAAFEKQQKEARSPIGESP
jgi:hypothetical protein